MKIIVLIAAAIFLMSNSKLQGRKLGIHKNENVYSRTGCRPNPVMSTGNGTAIIFENSEIKLKDVLKDFRVRKSEDPTIIRKRVRCICDLPVCKCCRTENPENWFVKTFLISDEKPKLVRYHVIHCKANITEGKPCPHDSKSTEKWTWGGNLDQEAFSRKPRRKNKWLFGCLPLLNLKKDKPVFRECFSGKINFNCDCTECHFHSEKGKSGVLLKCARCGPIFKNTTTEPVNYSNLLLKRSNRLKIKTNFLQIN